MSFKGFARTISLISAVAVAPVLSMAATPQTCKPGAPTAESYTWNFTREASKLLTGMQVDAMHVRSHAAELQNFEMTPSLSWQAHAGQLMDIRHEVDNMGAKLCRLETIRTAVAPWERQAIDRVAPTVRLLADNTQDAILYLNRHQGEFWRPAYREYTQNLYQQANMLSHSVKSFEEYAKARTQSSQLGKELGVRVGS